MRLRVMPAMTGEEVKLLFKGLNLFLRYYKKFSCLTVIIRCLDFASLIVGYQQLVAPIFQVNNVFGFDILFPNGRTLLYR